MMTTGTSPGKAEHSTILTVGSNRMRSTLKTIGNLFLALSLLVMARADEDVVSAVHTGP
jgi:hypothetical protein